MQPKPSDHAAPARQAPIGGRKASFCKEFQNLVRGLPAGSKGCPAWPSVHPGSLPFAIYSQPIGEFRLVYTTLGLVALAPAPGLGSGSGVRSGLRFGTAAGELIGQARTASMATPSPSARGSGKEALCHGRLGHTQEEACRKSAPTPTGVQVAGNIAHNLAGSRVWPHSSGLTRLASLVWPHLSGFTCLASSGWGSCRCGPLQPQSCRTPCPARRYCDVRGRCVPPTLAGRWRA